MAIFKCPHCFKEYDLDIKLSWKTWQCNKCWEKFIINFEEKSINEVKENENQTSVPKENTKTGIDNNIEKIDVGNNLVKANQKNSKKDYIKKCFIKTIKSPPLLLNILLITHVIVLIFLYNVWDLFITIFVGIIIPLINIYIIKHKKNDLTKIQVFLTLLALLLNIFLFILFFIFLSEIWIPKKIDDLLLSVLLLLIPIFSLKFILKNNNIKTKIIKFIKYLLILLFTWAILVLISIYISSLGSYKESDFNIPQDAFQTKFWDKDPYSEENWFNDLVDFINSLENREDLGYFDILSKCIFDEKYIEKWKCENDKQWYIAKQKKKLKSNIFSEIMQDLENNKISSDQYREYQNIFVKDLTFSVKDIERYPRLEEYIDFEKQFENKSEQFFHNYKRFVHIMNIKSNKIKSKEYILELSEYSYIYNWKQDYWAWKSIVFTDLIQYSRWQRYVIYKYFEDWDYNAGIKLLLEHQNFIDNLTNKTDASLINSLVNISLSKNNLEILDYILNNYELPENLHNKIITSLEYKIDGWLITNSLKREHIINRTIFKYLFDSSFISGVDYIWEKDRYFTDLIQMMEGYLFFSVKETELISDKYAYNHIYKHPNWSCQVNLNNYLWRTIACNLSATYEAQYQKEENIKILRKNILEKLKDQKNHNK